MKISKIGQYALLCVVDLALNASDKHQSIASVAKRQKIDSRFLAQIFFALKNAGIISSIRGKDGGYYVNKDINNLTAGDVVRAVEGELAPTRCSIDTKSCISSSQCITRALWQQVAKEISCTLDSITIADIIELYNEEQWDANS